MKLWNQDHGFFFVLRFVITSTLISGFVYQSLGTFRSYLKFPTTMDASMEGLETLKFPGISLCITNWINRTSLCARYHEFCNFDESMKPKLRALLETAGNLSAVAAHATEIIQTTFEDPSLYYYRFVYEDRHMTQTYSRLPKHMCYTLNWKGNPDMDSYHEYPPLFEFTLYIQWRTDQIIALDEFEATMGFHSVDVLNAGKVHSMILKPNGNYEYTTEQVVTRLLPPPYDTNCVHYEKLGKHPAYPAFMTQTLCNFECQRQITRKMCNCTPTGYPFRNKLNENACSQKVTAECVQTRSKALYNIECPKRCQSACEDTTYTTILGYSGNDNSSRIKDLRFVNVKIIMPSRSVDILRAVPQLTGTNALAIFGGYLGIWLGHSLHSILRMTVFNIFKKIVRMADGIYLKLTLACLGRSFLVMSFLLCAYICGLQALHDLQFYLRYPGQVQHLQQRMTSVRFPAFSFCVEKGFNLSALCEWFTHMDCEDNDGQRIIGAYLEETKTLLRFHYARELVIYQCDFVSEDPACASFGCEDAWEASFTRYIDNVCWTFDVYTVGKKPGHPLTNCPSPWKYYLKASVAANVVKLKERPFVSALLHEPGSTGASIRPTMKFRAGDHYRIAAFQSDSKSLPKPYESHCTDYERLTSRTAYASRQLQADECAERCLMDKWFDSCQCISKLYPLKHLLKAPMCDIFTHVQCTTMMRSEKWRQSCLYLCSLPCTASRYRAEVLRIGSRLRNTSRLNEIKFELRMGTDLTKILQSHPRIDITDIVSILEGHIGLWLGVSILGVASNLIKYWTSLRG